MQADGLHSTEMLLVGIFGHRGEALQLEIHQSSTNCYSLSHLNDSFFSTFDKISRQPALEFWKRFYHLTSLISRKGFINPNVIYTFNQGLRLLRDEVILAIKT